MSIHFNGNSDYFNLFRTERKNKKDVISKKTKEQPESKIQEQPENKIQEQPENKIQEQPENKIQEQPENKTQEQPENKTQEQPKSSSAKKAKESKTNYTNISNYLDSYQKQYYVIQNSDEKIFTNDVSNKTVSKHGLNRGENALNQNSNTYSLGADPEPEPNPTSAPAPAPASAPTPDPNVTEYGDFTFNQVLIKDVDGDDATMYHYVDSNGKEGYVKPYVYSKVEHLVLNNKKNENINNEIYEIVNKNRYNNPNDEQANIQVVERFPNGKSKVQIKTDSSGNRVVTENYSNGSVKTETEIDAASGIKVVTEYYKNSLEEKSIIAYDKYDNIIGSAEDDEDGFWVKVNAMKEAAGEDNSQKIPDVKADVPRVLNISNIVTDSPNIEKLPTASSTPEAEEPKETKEPGDTISLEAKVDALVEPGLRDAVLQNLQEEENKADSPSKPKTTKASETTQEPKEAKDIGDTISLEAKVDALVEPELRDAVLQNLQEEENAQVQAKEEDKTETPDYMNFVYSNPFNPNILSDEDDTKVPYAPKDNKSTVDDKKSTDDDKKSTVDDKKSTVDDKKSTVDDKKSTADAKSSSEVMSFDKFREENPDIPTYALLNAYNSSLGANTNEINVPESKTLATNETTITKDSAGNILSKIIEHFEYSADGEKMKTGESTINKNGNVSVYVEYVRDANGNVIRTDTYETDGNGNIIETRRDSDGNETVKVTDKDGKDITDKVDGKSTTSGSQKTETHTSDVKTQFDYDYLATIGNTDINDRKVLDFWGNWVSADSVDFGIIGDNSRTLTRGGSGVAHY